MGGDCGRGQQSKTHPISSEVRWQHINTSLKSSRVVAIDTVLLLSGKVSVVATAVIHVVPDNHFSSQSVDL